MRAITSLVPPAGNGLMIFTGLLGQLSCAVGRWHREQARGQRRQTGQDEGTTSHGEVS